MVREGLEGSGRVLRGPGGVLEGSRGRPEGSPGCQGARIRGPEDPRSRGRIPENPGSDRQLWWITIDGAYPFDKSCPKGTNIARSDHLTSFIVNYGPELIDSWRCQ